MRMYCQFQNYLVCSPIGDGIVHLDDRVIT